MDKLSNSKKEEYLNNTSDIYRKIFENSFDAILLVDDKSRYVDANLSACNLLGDTKSELINMKVEDLTPKKYIEHGKKLSEEFLEKGNQKGEYILLKKDKEEINVEYRGFANIVPGLHLFIIKDTNSKKLNKVLKDREKTLQGIFTASPVGINLIQNRKFVWSNEMMSEITGYPLNEIIDKNTRFLYVSDEDYEKAGYDYNKKLAEGNVAEVETRWRRKDGKIINIHKKMSLVDPTEPGKGYITSVMDITDSKKIEENLSTAKKQLEEIIEFLPDATFIIDKNKKVIAWNHAMEEMTGIDKENILGNDHECTAVPFYGKRRAHLVDLLFEDNDEIKSKYNFVNKKGRSLYVEVYTPALYNNKGAYVWAAASPLLDQKGNIVGAIESIRDISEFKDTEKKIVESEKTLRSILTAAPVGIKLVKDREIIWCNPSMLEMTGYALEELINKNLKFLYPNDEEYTKVGHMLYDKWFDEEYREIETIWKKSNGELINCHIRVSPIDPSDFSKGMIEIITDTTERKKAQKQLDENLEYFAHLVDHIRNPLTVLSGVIMVEVDNEKTKGRVQKQVDHIEEILEQLDQGWIDTEETRKFLKKYM